MGRAGSQAMWPQVTAFPGREARVLMIEGSPAEAARILDEKLIAEKVV